MSHDAELMTIWFSHPYIGTLQLAIVAGVFYFWPYVALGKGRKE